MATKRAAFGGYTINFKGVKDSLETVFGSKPVTPAEMTKKLWEYVKKNKLSK
ncbi:MAG: SWIB/MDM2 domain-containing protein [Candidatus Methylomirabilales bacterium]